LGADADAADDVDVAAADVDVDASPPGSRESARTCVIFKMLIYEGGKSKSLAGFV